MTETPFAHTVDSETDPRDDDPAAALGQETLRSHRNLVDLQEWLHGQLPWQRGITRRVAGRIKAA